MSASGTAGVTVVLDGEVALRAALARLARDAPAASVVELRSAAPLPEDLQSLPPTRRPRAPIVGILGAVGAGSAAWLIAVFTAKAYPLVTGHMPIVAGPPTGIVVYEGVALGAVLATTLCMLVEGRLLRRRPAGSADADARIAAGAIEITVDPGPGGDPDELQRILTQS